VYATDTQENEGVFLGKEFLMAFYATTGALYKPLADKASIWGKDNS